MFHALFNPAVLALLIPLAAISGHFILKSQKMRYQHEERLEKIRCGMDPDGEDDLSTTV